MILKLNKLHLENFKGIKNEDFEFRGSTVVSGKNGVGKSTLAEAYMWLLFGCGYDLTSNPAVRRKVDGESIDDVPVIVEATLKIDGKEVVAKKVQKRSFDKNGGFADTNTYFINDVAKTLRDFSAYFDVDIEKLKLCSNVNAFLAQKTKEMREFLFSLAGDMTDADVAEKYDEFRILRVLLEKYTTDELTAMNKASVTKLKKEQAGIDPAIAENRRFMVDEADSAELELQKNVLEKKIAEKDKQLEDHEVLMQEAQKKTDDIMELQFKKTTIEREAFGKLRKEKSELQKEKDDSFEKFNNAFSEKIRLERQIENLQKEIGEAEENTKALLKRWQEVKEQQFIEISDNDLLCPTCGQPLPEDLKQKKMEQAKEEKERFLAKRKEKLESINETGKGEKKKIEEKNSEIEKLKQEIESKKVDMKKYNLQQAKAEESLKSMPDEPDLMENQEYVAICREIETKTKAMKQEDNGVSYRAMARKEKQELVGELDEVKKKLLAISKNVEYEERIAELEKNKLTIEQEIANAQRTLDSLDELNKKKNELLADEINKHFEIVKWDLFKIKKNGTYDANYCRPVINGKDYNDDANTGLRMLATLDIANSIQDICGIYCPIFLDCAESLDTENMEKVATGASQVIALKVTDDETLQISQM